jgi:hypothetical protein
MRRIATIAVILSCGACQPDPSEKQIASAAGQLQSQQAQAQPECRDFSGPVTAGGKPQQASGQACRQPDGSWHVVQKTPGLPPQDYVIPPPAQTAANADSAAQPTADQPLCGTFTVPVTVGGQQQQATVESCQQPDGSWRVTQNTPGLPQQVYVVPPPPPEYGYPYPDYYAYPDVYPYWFASPWFYGLGPTIFVAQRFSHFRFHHGFVHGFHHGISHGFQRGFSGGFARAGGMGGGHHR